MTQPQANRNRSNRARVLAAALTLSAAGWGAWKAAEGDGPVVTRPDGVEVHKPYVPTAGDVPTIGHGSTRYEDGTPVRLTDKPITRARAEELALNLHSEEEQRFKATLNGVKLHQDEFDLYLDFTGQYGIGNWSKSSILTNLKAGRYVEACDSLLKYRFQNKRDCRLPQNWGPRGCKGVWTRQEVRHAKCMAVQ